MYINSTTSDVWGPKINDTTWPATPSLNIEGATGVTGYSPRYIVAPGAPAAGVGNNGDMYINSTTSDVWGPKSGGLWPASPACNIKGATGPQGPAGLNLTDPTTTKGDFIIRQSPTVLTRLGVGSDGYVLTADAAQLNGVKWAPAPGGGGSQTPWVGNIDGDGFTLSDVGKIGIGTGVVPATILHLAQTVSGGIGPVITLENSTGAQYDAASIRFWDASLRSVLKFSVEASPWGGDMIFISGGSGTTEIFRATSSGRFAIGTAAPLSPLDVVTGSMPVGNIAAGSGGFRLATHPWASAPTLLMGVDLDLAASWIQAAQFGSGVNPILLNPTGGAVGIGLSTVPVVKLHVGGIAIANPNLSADTGGFYLGFGSTVGLAFGAYDGATSFAPWIQTKRTANNGVADALAINPLGGNVGIGTAVPANPLHIRVGTNQNILFGVSSSVTALQAVNDAVSAYVPMLYRASSHAFTDGNVVIGQTSPGVSKLSFGAVNPDVNSRIAFFEGAGGVSFRGVGMAHPTANYGVAIWASTSAVPTDTNMQLFVQDDGPIGIGNSAPQGRLSINAAANPTTVAAAKQITIGEPTNGTGYYLALGYLVDAGAWKGSIQNYAGGVPAPLILQGAGHNVGIGKLAPGYVLDVQGDCNISGTYRVNGTPLSTGGGVTTQNVVTGSRAVGTVYQNTTGKPMSVAVTVAVASASPANVAGQTDAGNPPSTIVQNFQFSGISFTAAVRFEVLPGNFYRVNANNAPSLISWVEWY